MTGKKRFSLMLDAIMLARLNAIRARVGLSLADQVRRGTELWLESTERPLSVNTPTGAAPEGRGTRWGPDRARGRHVPGTETR